MEERLTVIKDFMTRKDMMDYFDIKTDTLLDWENQGLNFKKIGRKKYYEKEEIKRFIRIVG